MPENFVRATGRTEFSRRCTECQRAYRVTDHALSEQCPHCGSMATERVRQVSAQASQASLDSITNGYGG